MLTPSAFFGRGDELLIHAAFDLVSPVPEPESPAPAKDEEDSATPAPDAAANAAAQRKAAWKPSGSSVGRIFRPNTADKDTLVVSRQEWDDMKASQRRLEDMLEKVLTITSATK